MQVVELEVAADQAELAADALWQAGATAVSEEATTGDRVRLRADVEALARVDPRWRPTVIEVDPDAHLDAWRAFARPRVAGPLRLQPAWLEHVAGEGELVVRLDPGRAFGSGAHPSTRLAIEALARWLPPGGAVLDLGCGSGVLAVAAALLGAGLVVAVDVDAEAVRATAANAARNGVDVEVSRASAAEVGGSFDVVVANIGAGVLIDHAGAVQARAVSGGHLVLAGFLAERADAVARAYTGCAEVDRRADDGWVALVLRA